MDRKKFLPESAKEVAKKKIDKIDSIKNKMISCKNATAQARVDQFFQNLQLQSHHRHMIPFVVNKVLKSGVESLRTNKVLFSFFFKKKKRIITNLQYEIIINYSSNLNITVLDRKCPNRPRNCYRVRRQQTIHSILLFFESFSNCY